MSYILEALKKSDQQRQRGSTPTLPTAQVIVAAPKRPLLMYYGALAAVLLGAGIAIVWLRPWQAEQPAPAAESAAARPSIPTPQQAAPAPLPALPEMARKPAPELPAPNTAPAVQPAPRVETMKPEASAPAGSAIPSAIIIAPAHVPEKLMPEKPLLEKSGSPAGVAQDQRTIPMAELPPAIQQEIPAMTIQLHAYSSNPAERLVSINFRMLREGGSLASGIRLEEITPDGMIFSYKGYRFQRGAR